MGVDAMIYSRGTLTPEVVEAIHERTMDTGHPFPTLEQEGEYVYMSNHWRYYGPGYERGPWQAIAPHIEAMRAVFGNVYYFGDHSFVDEVDEFTTDDAAAMWEHWRGPDWDAYRRR